MATKRKLLFGVDPGTGRASPTGLVLIEPASMAIRHAIELGASDKVTDRRIKTISDHFELELLQLESQIKNATFDVYMEKFVMKGKAGQVLQQMIGGLISRVPRTMGLDHVQNTTVKLVIAGHGHADKTKVAEGVAYLVRKNPEAAKLIFKWIDDGNWDLIDATAIALAGWRIKNERLNRD